MRFERESYRKLYVRESAEDRMRPLFARGLRDYLLRHAKEDGTLLESTDDPAGDLIKVLVAHPSERKATREAVKDFLATGYLTHQDRRLWITRFEDAQSARSPGATRQAKYRQTHPSPKAVTGDTGHGVTGDIGVTSPITSPLADETRRELADEMSRTSRGDAPLGPVRCPMNLWELFPDDAKGTLETAMIPRWAQEQICKGFVAKQAGKRGGERSLDAWFSTVVTVIQGDWNNPSKRPKKPQPEPPKQTEEELNWL